MCNGSCKFFQKSIPDDFHYCQECAKFVGYRYLYREEKIFGRLRCSCCNGLVRNKKRKKHNYFVNELQKSLSERGYVVKDVTGNIIERLDRDIRPSHMKD